MEILPVATNFLPLVVNFLPLIRFQRRQEQTIVTAIEGTSDEDKGYWVDELLFFGGGNL